jgi:hypothetical protein
MDITEYALPTDRGLTRGDGQLVDFLRCVAALAWVGRSSTSNLEIYSRSRADLGPRAEQQLLGTRRPPRRVPFDARALSMARMSS